MLFLALLGLVFVGFPQAAFAQEEGEGTELDDGDESEAESGEAESADTSGPRSTRLIKVVKKKFFLKYRRLEVTPTLAAMPSDFFLRRYIFGVNLAYHVSEIFSIELFGAYSPNLKDVDKKPLFNYLRRRVSIQADISRIMMLLQLDLGLSPIYGKVEFAKSIVNYDLYLLVGGGMVFTVDDEEIASQEPEDRRYVRQLHPSANFGLGFRVAFNEWFAIRLEGRWTFHVEQVVLSELALELKNNFSIHLGASFFLPPKIEN
jgi:outer membrane beta-barrel protein